MRGKKPIGDPRATFECSTRRKEKFSTVVDPARLRCETGEFGDAWVFSELLRNGGAGGTDVEFGTRRFRHNFDGPALAEKGNQRDGTRGPGFPGQILSAGNASLRSRIRRNHSRIHAFYEPGFNSRQTRRPALPLKNKTAKTMKVLAVWLTLRSQVYHSYRRPNCITRGWLNIPLYLPNVCGIEISMMVPALTSKRAVLVRLNVSQRNCTE
jgi:hypothetical protein